MYTLTEDIEKKTTKLLSWLLGMEISWQTYMLFSTLS